MCCIAKVQCVDNKVSCTFVCHNLETLFLLRTASVFVSLEKYTTCYELAVEDDEEEEEVEEINPQQAGRGGGGAPGGSYIRGLEPLPARGGPGDYSHKGKATPDMYGAQLEGLGSAIAGWPCCVEDVLLLLHA